MQIKVHTLSIRRKEEGEREQEKIYNILDFFQAQIIPELGFFLVYYCR